MRSLLIFLFSVTPSVALACGGLFCNNVTPVNQAAERILFAPTDDGLDMHVRITYAGPPTSFGWLLPVPRDVDYGLSSEMLFAELDRNFAPTFQLVTEFDDGCGDGFGIRAPNEAGGLDSIQSEGEEPNVQVLSREAVGPYDLAVLLPETVEDLREWLNENEFEIPEAADATLGPYVEMGAAFLALKLLPSSDSGDVQPLRLSFSGDTPAIPIIPTSVAADPDMGILVHLLGPSRAVPANYRHVRINETALDWANSGQNYADVVSQAVDEAGGQAFVTDFAGAHDERVLLPIVDIDRIEALRARDSSVVIIGRILFDNQLPAPDSDLSRVVRGAISIEGNIDIDDVMACPQCFRDNADQIQLDLDRVIAGIEEQINEPRERLQTLFSGNSYLTRLYSTMSADEMTIDPSFGFNRDLEDVSNSRVATRRVRCVMGEPDFENAIIETPSGLVYRESGDANPNLIRRQAGETVRGIDVPGAQIIEEPMAAGEPELVEDKTAEIEILIGAPSDGGCACDVMGGGGMTSWALLGLLLLPFFRRRRA